VKTKEKEEAIRLRKEEGLSLKDISEKLCVAKSSVSLWVRDIELTDEQLKKLIENNKLKINQLFGSQKKREIYLEKREIYQEEGRIKALENDPDHKAMCMLYWAEGAKNRNSLKLSNSDMFLLKYFLNVLFKEFDLKDKDIVLVFNAYLNNGLTFNEVKKYWLKNLNLPETCLRKCQLNSFPTSSSGKKIGKLKYGTASLTVNNTRIVQHIFGAIQEYAGFRNENWID